MRLTGWVTERISFHGYDGAMQTGWVEMVATDISFDASGLMKTGWVQDNGQAVLLNSSGAMQKGCAHWRRLQLLQVT